MSERYWKVLNDRGESCHGGSFRWSLPRWSNRHGWIPGEWTPLVERPNMCERGYHVCRDRDLVHWLHARIYACEVRGRVLVGDDKVCVGQVRLTCPTPWDDVSARLFAVECAADVLSLYESKYPNDSRVGDCLEVAFRFAVGNASDSDLAAASDAASDAAYAATNAARAAASDAAWAAARAAWAGAWATNAGAWAARAAASDANSAAWAAAWAAARARQTDRLLWWIGAR